MENDNNELNELCDECISGKHSVCQSLNGVPCSCTYVLPNGGECSILLPSASDEGNIYLDSEHGLVQLALAEQMKLGAKELPETNYNSYMENKWTSGSYQEGTNKTYYTKPAESYKTEYSKWTPSKPSRKCSFKVHDEIIEKNLLSKSNLKVYRTLFEIGPATAGEITRAIQLDQGGSGYHKRLPDLDRQSVVYKTGKRVCKVSGKTCDLWDVTDSYPIAKSKYKRVVKPLACGTTAMEAAVALAVPIGWKVKEMNPVVADGYDWGLDVEVEGGDIFRAAGFKIAGGYSLMRWT